MAEWSVTCNSHTQIKSNLVYRLSRKTRNLVPSGASVRIWPTSIRSGVSTTPTSSFLSFHFFCFVGGGGAGGSQLAIGVEQCVLSHLSVPAYACMLGAIYHTLSRLLTFSVIPFLVE